MDDRHVALKLARADAGKSDAVAVLGIHVGLDLEDEGGEGLVIGRDGDFLTVPGRGWRRVFEKALEQEFHPEIVHGTAEEYRGHLP